MDKLIEVLAKAIEAVLKAMGFPDAVINEVKAVLAVLLVLSVGIGLIYKYISWLIENRKRRILDTDLAPYFSYNDVLNARRFYVNTKHQSVAPSIDEELGGMYISAPKQNLIPFFTNEVFTYKNKRNRFFLVLADSGMGKTTFMINLYIAYTKKSRWSYKPEFDIKLIPLGAKDALDKVKTIEKKESTILLLDAFDEDIAALKNYDGRWKEILAAIGNFRTVVISCRTQFFPTDKDVPHETGYFNHGKGEEIKFEKSYLSVFDEKDIEAYIHKRYSILFHKKRKKAMAIVAQCPNLMVRPMLLSHIDDLVNSETEIKTTTQLYEILIQKWVERESKKPGIRENYGSEEKYQDLLLKFSQKLAQYLYSNRDKGGYVISKNITFKSMGISLATLENETLALGENANRSKSLLNRDALGNYKFSHKSILEYLLAKEIMNESKFGIGFNFTGMDMTRLFYYDMLDDYLNTVEAKPMRIPYHKKTEIFIERPETDILKLSPLKISIIYNVKEYHYLVHTLNYILMFEPALVKKIQDRWTHDNIFEFFRKGKPIEILQINTPMKNGQITHISLHGLYSREFIPVDIETYKTNLLNTFKPDFFTKNVDYIATVSEIKNHYMNHEGKDVPPILEPINELLGKVYILEKGGLKVYILQYVSQHSLPAKNFVYSEKKSLEPASKRIRIIRGDIYEI